MTKEDIKKAAVDSCVFENSIFNPELTPYYEQGFKDGANWRINSVWHDIKEMPENNRMILIIMQHDIPTVIGPDNTFFREEIKDRHIQRWVYVEDLIPNKEE